jgi:hypothetical protein
MNPPILARRISLVKARIIAGSIAALLAVPAANAQTTYYWDSNGSTAGFGNTTGTWGTDSFWSTDIAGTSATANPTITTADTVNFGTATLNYANGTVTGPAAAQGFLNMNFGAGQTTALVISGGTRDWLRHPPSRKTALPR